MDMMGSGALLMEGTMMGLVNSLQRYGAGSDVNQGKDDNHPFRPDTPRTAENGTWRLEPRAGVGARRLDGLNRRTMRDAGVPVASAVPASGSGISHLPRAIRTQLHERSLDEVGRDGNAFELRKAFHIFMDSSATEPRLRPFGPNPNPTIGSPDSRKWLICFELCLLAGDVRNAGVGSSRPAAVPPVFTHEQMRRLLRRSPWRRRAFPCKEIASYGCRPALVMIRLRKAVAA
jgi:hypothetical protein